MFRLLKIQNSKCNVPEPIKLSTGSAVTLKAGQPIHYTNETATAMSASSTALPTHMVLADATSTRKVLAFPLSADMRFEVPLAAAIGNMKCGNEYLLGTDGLSLSATAVSGSLRGAVLVDKNGAAAAGDTVTVMFPCR